jgi:hypothetical protein
MLDASTSSDDNGDGLYFLWTQVSGPAQAQVLDSTTMLATAIINQAGVYVFQVRVSDGCTAPTTTVTVVATCGTVLALPGNQTVFSAYDGELPVTMMTIGFDFPASMPDPTSQSARCQSYQWTLGSFSETVRSLFVASFFSCSPSSDLSLFLFFLSFS